VAAVIRHTLTEGWLLIRQRGLVGLTLAAAFAAPLCLGGVTLTINRWLGPLADLSSQEAVVAVLLHPRMAPEQRQQWIEETRQSHPQWAVEAVPPAQLVERLTHWFPYLGDLVESEGDDLLPPLVEVTTADPEGVATLAGSPAVIAVGPRSSLNLLVSRAAQRVSGTMLMISAVLLAAAALLASVWVHLELYRHADEITIMRLIGATEAAVRGPFLLAVVSPGIIAAVLSIAGTLALSHVLSRAAHILGLPPISIAPEALVLQVVLACLLPMAAALITLARHSARGLDD